jgi:hypothetical protein
MRIPLGDLLSLRLGVRMPVVDKAKLLMRKKGDEDREL